MGLGIMVGYLSDMKHHDEEGYAWATDLFDTVNRFLESKDLPTWEESEEFDRSQMRPHLDAFPYSFLHYLRRAYAHAYERPDDELLPTGEEGLTPADDRLIEDASMMMSSHLLCHSDCAGLYVPVDFPDPLFDLDDMGIPGGGMLGSSHGLMRELREVAPYLGIELEDGVHLSDAEAQRLYDTADDNPLDREFVVFLALWENARASIAQHSAIVFV